jgi:gliding motility-associated-like protein
MKTKYQFKTGWFLFFTLLPSLLYCQGLVSKNKNSGKVIWTVKNPFVHKVFVENRGQFDEAIPNSEKILYFAKVGKVKAYFTASGVYYQMDENSEKNNSGKEEEHPEERGNVPPVIRSIFMHWAETNTSSQTLEASDESSDYFTYTGPKGGTIKANGFRKIAYKNIYPNIDIVYSFPDKGGIEYSFLLHPGADVNNIKMDYSDKSSLQIGMDGSISHSIISSITTDIIEYAPEAHYASNQANKINSSFVKQGDMLAIQLGEHDANTEIVIDPWVINPGFVNSDRAFDIGKDLSGNIYVQGGGELYGAEGFEVEKFNSVGTLQWTYTTPWIDWKGGFAVDGTGCSYVADGCCSGDITKLTPSGAIRLSITTTTTEYWMMSFDCSLSELYIGIGYHMGSIALMDTATGVLSGTTVIDNVNETRAMGWAPNTNLYFISETSNIMTAINSAFATLFTVPTSYVWGYDPNPNYVTGLSPVTGQNAIAGGLTFLATSDGLTLDKWNLNTGALITQTLIPGGIAEYLSGITVDYCGNIFVGGLDSVFQYDTALNEINSIYVPDSVYCVIQGNNSDILAGGAGFLTDLDFTALSTSSVNITSTNAGCSTCNATATATLKLCGIADTTTGIYLWSNGQTTRTATGLCSGTYRVAVSGCFQNSYIDSVTISGGLNTTSSTTSPSCTSNNGSITVSASGGVSPYSWSWNNGSTTQTISGLSAGTYTCVMQDNTGCADTNIITLVNIGAPTVTITPPFDTLCPGNNATLLASGATTYSWLPAAGLSCTGCANPTSSPATTTTYTVTGSDGTGCSNTDSVIVVIKPPPLIAVIPSSDTVCNGGSVSLSASGGVSYSWSPASGLSCTSCSNPTANPTLTTIYTVTGTDASGCTATASVAIYIALPPAISVSASQSSICQGTTVTLLASASNVTSPFNWQPGSLPGASVSVTPSVTTTYTVTASSACGTATASVTISVNDAPVPVFSADVTNGCAPMCIQFRDASTVGTGRITQWGWVFGNGDTSNQKTPIFCYPKPGIYSVSLTATSDSGCSSDLSVSDMITIYSSPIANFTAAPQPTTILEPAIQFTNLSTDNYGIIAWIWTFGESGDTISNQENPGHVYRDTGTFCPVLIAVNRHGCSDTITNCLIINPIFTCYIPDAFSPNGDGLNDVFNIKGNDIHKFEMYIFDRWGLQLFHSTDINYGWNGRLNNEGSICQEDAYVYMITVYDNKDQKHAFLGTLNLIK